MKRIIWSVTMIPLIATAVLMQFMPESVPMHFDISGKADRWGSKYERSHSMPDEKERAGAASNAKIMKIIVLCIAVFFNAVDGFILYNAYSMSKEKADNTAVDTVRIVCILFGVLMIVMANFIPKSRKNRIMGLRTKWTMYNDITWRKSNMFGAAVLMLTGALTIIGAALTAQTVSVILMLVFLMTGTAACIVYSRIVYKKELNKADKSLPKIQ